jgi:3-oxoacyl-(acyl-carrier-protein) synthase
MDKPEIVISGVGVLSPIGCSEQEVLNSLLDLRSGISLWESDQLTKRFPVGRVMAPLTDNYTRVELPFLERTTLLALQASRQAMTAAGIANFAAYGERAGVFYGTVRGGGEAEWEWLRQFHVEKRQTARPYVLMGSMPNAAAAQISIRCQVSGPVATHTSACSSSGAAIVDACRHLLTGEIDVALVGGAESPLSPMFLGAWDGLRAMADVDGDDVSRSCKPFSTRRNGLVVSEGSVFYVMETRHHAENRGVRPRAILSGWGVASDAYHIGMPHSRGQIAAMRLALRNAGLRPGDLDYINAHATATPGGDPIEVVSLKEVLGDAINVPVSSTKAQHGHMLGGASAMELLVCLLAMENDFVPATAHLDDIDPACAGLHHVQATRRDQTVRRALSLSAGFGGTNVALVLSAVNT